MPVMENKVAPRIMMGRLACILGRWGSVFPQNGRKSLLRGTVILPLPLVWQKTIFKTMKYQAQSMEVLLSCGKRDHLHSI